MIKGIVLALGACFIWGLIFVVPQLMAGFSSLEVALGRHFCYGSISFFLFLKHKYFKGLSFPLKIWRKALWFALITNIIYYTFLVLSIRYATAAVCALIVGISPICITFWANFKQKELSYKSLLLPSLFILLGLVFVNLPHFNFSTTHSASSYFFGLLSAIIALVSWSWYVVNNAQFLKENPEIQSNEWSTLLGVATLFWVVVVSLTLGLFLAHEEQLQKYVVYSEQLQSFVFGSLVLGLLCSWVGAFFWNMASLRLPIILAGQLTIFETIFGVLFVYTFEQRMPSLLEGAGIACMLAATGWGITLSAKRPLLHAE